MSPADPVCYTVVTPNLSSVLYSKVSSARTQELAEV